MTTHPPLDTEQALVLITSTDPNVNAWGTAFVFHSDDRSTYLVTCSHVISEVGGPTKVKAGDRSASVVASGEDEVDVAILRVDGPLNKPSLSLSSVARSRSSFRLVGITKLASKFQSQPLSGTFGKAVTVYCRGSLVGHKAWELRMDSDCKLEQGQSGSPVLTDDGKCVAIAAVKIGQGQSGIAISIDVLRHIWPDRPKDIFPSNDPPQGSRSEPEPRANLDDEVYTFERVVSGATKDTKVVVISAESGMGKTRLLQEYLRIVTDYELRTVIKNLTQQLSVEDFLQN